MKHICFATFNKYTFGIAVDKSVDWPDGYYRLIDENTGEQLANGDGFASEQEAVDAIFALYPDNDF